VIANKLFGFSPDQTLEMSNQTLNSMIMEYHFMQSLKEDERGEYEMVELQTIEGPKKIKKYFDTEI